MSKVLKSSDFSNESSRVVTSSIKTKRSAFLNPSASKLMIGRHSPYSKLQSINTRSSSSLKKSPQLNLKNLSPCQNSHISILRSSESKRKKSEKKSTVKNNSLSKSWHETREPLTEKFADFHKDANLIEMKLNEKLRGLNGGSKKEVFVVYREVFEDVVRKDKIFAGVLERIFEYFKGFAKQTANSAKIEDLEAKTKILEVNLKLQVEKTKDFEKKCERLAKENYEISKELDKTQDLRSDLEKYLKKITNFTLDCPKEALSWQALVLENQKYSEVLKSQSTELKSLASKQKTLLHLLSALKQKGYPIEQTYADLTSHSPQSSNSETENLLSDRLHSTPKPSIIPTLNISLLQPFSFSSSFSDSY